MHWILRGGCDSLKVHLLLKKEEIDTVQMSDDKIAVVFDVLLATSTIISCLQFGAKEVIPVMNGEEAILMAKDYKTEDVALVGEYDGITIDGFLSPAPSRLEEHVKNKTVLLSTTNGTVAIRQSAPAKEVYIASLLNGEAVSKQIIKTYDNETIIVVCSGSSNQFCLEDFYGAGYFIEQLVKEYGLNNIELTDSALASKIFYQNLSHEAYNVLSESRVGQMLHSHDLQQDLAFVSKQGELSIIPILLEKKIICLEKMETCKGK